MTELLTVILKEGNQNRFAYIQAEARNLLIFHEDVLQCAEVAEEGRMNQSSVVCIGPSNGRGD